MAYWIFVINDTDEVFAERMKERTWPIFVYTQNRRHLNVGDHVIFYKAGAKGQKFLGSARVSSPVEKKKIDYSMGLGDIAIWKEGVSVVPLLEKLEFVRNMASWGVYFQGGVKSISEDDYTTIVNSANKKNV